MGPEQKLVWYSKTEKQKQNRSVLDTQVLASNFYLHWPGLKTRHTMNKLINTNKLQSES